MRALWLGLMALLVLAPAATAAPAADPWPRWERYDPSSQATVDHGPFARFLARYVVAEPDGSTRVAYAAVTPEDRSALAAYVQALEAVPVHTLSRAEQLAYWINLYNALILRTVLEHYPVHSIRDIRLEPAGHAAGPWGARLVTVEGQPLSLDDIEHRILRPLWRDPRVHYALSWAALGSPDLRPQPFTAADLDHQLDAAAMAFVNHPRGVQLAGDELVISSIYHWFEADFDGSEQAVLGHLMAYAAPPLAKELQQHAGIDAHRYDWRLNDAAPGS